MTGRDSGSAVRGGLALGVAQLLSRIFALIFVFAATHALGATVFGRYSVVSAVVIVASMFADFGTSAVVTREVSRYDGPAPEIVATVLPLSAAFGLLAYAGCVVFALTAGYQATGRVDILIGALAVPLGSVATTLLASLDGSGAILQRAVIGLLQTCVTMGVAILAVTLVHEMRLAIGGLPLGAAAALLTAVVVTRRRRTWSGTLTFDSRRRNDVLRLAWPFAALSLISAVSMRFDVLFLSLVSTSAETASYDVALRGVEAVLALGAVLTGPLLFLLSRRIGRGDLAGAQRAFNEAVKLALLVGLPLAAGAIALHDQIVAAAFGPTFRKSAVPLALLGAQVAPAAIGYLQGSLLMAGDHHASGARVAGAITSIIVVLDVALIPRYGAAGAAAASLVTSLATVLLFSRFHRATAGIALPAPQLPMLAAAAACGILAWLLRNLPLWAPVVSGGVVYMIIILVTGCFGMKDIRRITRAART